MGEKCNCYRFSPRDSLSGAVAHIADYLSKHPGWNENELRAVVDDLIRDTGVESFNGRTGDVILNKNDVNNLKIASAYFAEGDESIDSLDLVSLYNQGVRFVFTDFNSVTSGYNLSFALEHFSGSGGVVYYPMSTSSSGGNIVSVNGKTGTVHLKVVDVSNGNSPDENAYIFIDESDDYPDVISPDSNKLGGKLPSYYASAEDVSELKGDMSEKLGKTETAADSAKLGGKAPEYYLSPRNLLDNSDFTNPVNQRGQTSYAGDFIYTIDRWQTGDGTTTLAIQDDGVKVYSGTGTLIPYIYQRLEKLRAGVYTFAAKFHGNTSYVSISNYLTDNGAAVPTTGEENGIIVLSFSTEEDFGKDKAYFRLQGASNDNSVVWDWAALYEGAYTADTLPPYVPKGYAEELAECQRYYYKAPSILRSASFQDGVYMFNIQYPVTMRANPAISAEGVGTSLPDFATANASKNGLSIDAKYIFVVGNFSASADL